MVFLPEGKVPQLKVWKLSGRCFFLRGKAAQAGAKLDSHCLLGSHTCTISLTTKLIGAREPCASSVLSLILLNY